MEKVDCGRGPRGFGGSAALIGILLGAVLIGGPSFARAQPGAGVAAPAGAGSKIQIRAREMRTSRLLLEALERRRVAIDPDSGNSAATRQAIEFLDSRIKLLRGRIDKDIEFFRRAS